MANITIAGYSEEVQRIRPGVQESEAHTEQMKKYDNTELFKIYRIINKGIQWQAPDSVSQCLFQTFFLEGVS